MKYRSEIDGLRALAVVPVIFFHAGVEALSGGFVGVDIFFVISGYLITYLLIEENAKGAFSLIDFYDRRIRRILPALFLVLLTSSLVAWLWMLPSQMKEYSQSVLAVLLFISNFFFYVKSGYFSSSVDEKPLIHTWSLAVEEQFYIFFPLFMLLAWRFFKNKLAAVLVFGLSISYLLAELLSRTYGDLNFYLMPTRAWELSAGALCAWYIFKNQHSGSNTYLAFGGLALIVLSLFFINEALPYPSIYTVPPVLGTCLIILYSSNTVVGSLLSARLPVALGLLSYSAYLWHQPLLAFARIKSLTEPALWLMLGLGASSFLLAALSYRFIEQPFRKKSSGSYILPAKPMLTILGSCSVVLVAFGAAGHLTGGFPSRFSMPDGVAKTLERSTNAYACFDLPRPHKAEKWGCEIGANKPGQAPDFVVWGDSHLLVSFNAFVEAAKNTDKKGYYVGIRQCLPFLEIHALRFDQKERNCHALNKRVFDYVKNNKVKKLILVARWSYYSSGGYDGDNYAYVGLTPHSKKTPELSREAYLHGLNKTVEAYTGIGVELVFMEQVPQQKLHPEEMYYRAYSESDAETVLTALSVSREEHLAMQAYPMAQFRVLTKEHDTLSLLELTDVFCSDTCAVGDKTHSYYFDEDHLSVEGSKKLVQTLESAL